MLALCSRHIVSGARRQSTRLARCFANTAVCGTTDEFDDVRGQVQQLPEAQQVVEHRNAGDFSKSMEASERVVEVMGSMPDATYHHVALEQLCVSVLLHGRLADFEQKRQHHQSVVEQLDGKKFPCAKLRSANLAALLLLRQGNHRDALALLKPIVSNAKQWTDTTPALAEDPNFRSLRDLAALQLAAAALTQGVSAQSTDKLERIASSSEPTHAGEQVASQLATLHLRRAQLSEWSTAQKPCAIVDVGDNPDAETVSTAVDAIAGRCESLPLANIFNILHRTQLAELQALVGSAFTVDETLSKALELSDSAPAIPYCATFPLRSLARLYETTADISTAEALHTSNSDNIGAWYDGNEKQGTWHTVADGTVLISRLSVAEEYIRSLRYGYAAACMSPVHHGWFLTL